MLLTKWEKSLEIMQIYIYIYFIFGEIIKILQIYIYILFCYILHLCCTH